LEHTSLNKDDILMLSVAEIEGILDGMNRNSTIDDKATSGDNKVFEGHEGLQLLINNNGKI